MKVIDKFIKTLHVFERSFIAVAPLLMHFFMFWFVPAMIGVFVFDLPPYLSSVMGAFIFLISVYIIDDIMKVIDKFIKKICKEGEIKGILSRILEYCRMFVLFVVAILIFALPLFIAHFLLGIELGLSGLLSVVFWIIIMFVYVQYGGVQK